MIRIKNSRPYGTGESSRGTTHVSHAGSCRRRLALQGRRIPVPHNAGMAAQTTNLQAGLHPSGSRGNFGQIPLGTGLSLRPTPPCQFPLAYFPLSSPLKITHIEFIIARIDKVSRAMPRLGIYAKVVRELLGRIQSHAGTTPARTQDNFCSQ